MAGDRSPDLDVDFGTKIMFVARGQGDRGSRMSTTSIPGVFVTACVAAQSASGGSSVALDLAIVAVNSGGLTLGALADAKAGTTRGEGAVASTSLARYDIDIPRSSEVATVRGGAETLGAQHPELSFHAPAVAATHPQCYGWQRKGRVVSAVVDGSAGTCGLAVLDTATGAVEMWTAGETRTGLAVSAPVPVADGRHVVALLSGDEEEDARVVQLDIEKIAEGPVRSVTLGDTKLGPCVGGLWSGRVFTREEHGGKQAMSAYEMFESKDWNNINSNFSSFGFNQD